MKRLSSHLTFSNAALCFAMAYAWRAEGSPMSSALIVIAALSSKGVERFYFARSQQNEAETLKKDIKALQDRMGRTELSMGIKHKL